MQLTEDQLDVLMALNDLCDIHEVLVFHEGHEPLYEPLIDLNRHPAVIYRALADLQELDLIDGVKVDELAYPAKVRGLTVRGRQELPSG